MTAIRTYIMQRKVQWSIAHCSQCSIRQHACGLPCMVPCRRLSVLVNGRLYHRWFCQSCLASTWGTISPESSLPARLMQQSTATEQNAASSSPVAHPFKQGQRMGTLLMEQGMLEQFDLTTTHEREREAMRYARYAYPSANAEDLRTIAAGILHQWASHREGRQREC
jgi:hypothetical protein